VNRILAIETSSDICSVSLFSDGKVYNYHQSIPRQHARKVLSIVQDLLEAASLSLEDIDAYVYGQGPGSFTGVRIASGFVQGFSLAHQKPVYGVSTLTALCMAIADVNPGDLILPAIDARMHQVYWQPHKINIQGIPEPLEAPVVSDPQAITLSDADTNGIACGSGWQYQDQMEDRLVSSVSFHHLNTITDDDIQPSANQMINWVLKVKPKASEPGNVLPVYVRDKVTWDQKPKVGSL